MSSHREEAERRRDAIKHQYEADSNVSSAFVPRGKVSSWFYGLALIIVLPVGSVLVIGPVANLLLVFNGEAEMRREIVTGGLLGLSILSVCGAILRLIAGGSPAAKERVRMLREIGRCIAVGIAIPMFIGSVAVLIALAAGGAGEGTPVDSLLSLGGWTASLLGAGGVVTASMLALVGTSDLKARRRLVREEARESEDQSPDVL
jgi:hypothetical protein